MHRGGVIVANHCPISKQSWNITESLVSSRMKSFLSESCVLNSHQSGFRFNHSTTSAVTLVLNDLIIRLDNKNHCAAVFIDLVKAFDTADHSLFIDGLFTIGFERDACEWF